MGRKVRLEAPVTVHILYPFNAQIAELFFIKKTVRYHSMSKGEIKTGKIPLSGATRKFLSKFGYSFAVVSKSALFGKKSIAGIKIDVSKEMKGGKIKQVLIRIPAETYNDATERQVVIEQLVKEKTGIKGDPNMMSRRVC